MPLIFKFEVPGKPFGKQRPKTTLRGKHACIYTPKETVSYESHVVAMFRQKYPSVKPIEGEVKATIVAFYPIPASTSKKKKELMERYMIRPMVKPDGDNIEKVIYDALNGIAYTDDSHITAMSFAKFYSSRPRVQVTIEEIQNVNGDKKGEN